MILDIVTVRNMALDEVILKAKYVATMYRGADPKVFPTMVIRAEAVESIIEMIETMKLKPQKDEIQNKGV